MGRVVSVFFKEGYFIFGKYILKTTPQKLAIVVGEPKAL